MDWMPVYDGDVRRCAPLGLNCLLVRYARVLAMMAKEIRLHPDASRFAKDAAERASLIRKYCWNETIGLFCEFDFLAARQLPYVSECAFWTMWAGVATRKQAVRLSETCICSSSATAFPSLTKLIRTLIPPQLIC
jgi:alpha,alpha-trehalase